MIAKDLHLVTLLALYVCHINHTHVHADISHIVSLLAIDQTVTATITQMTIQTVCITNRDSSNTAVTFKHCLARVAHRVSCRHMANLQDGCLQGCHIIKNMIISSIYAIEPQPQTHHVQMVFRKMLNTCRVAYMTDDLMRIGLLQQATCLVVTFKLTAREGVKLIAITTHKMAEHRTRH